MSIGGLGTTATADDAEKLRAAPNAERDLHRLFKKHGLSLPIKIRKITHTSEDEEAIEFEHVDPSDWLSFLIRRYPFVLAGGDKPKREQLLGFWEIYRLHHPSHEVFLYHNDHLDRVWPLCFFGDEGRGPRRSTYMEGTIETPLGLSENPQPCNCCHILREMPTHWLPDMPQVESTPNMSAVQHVCSNYKGRSFLKRYLCFSLPGYVYDTRAEIVTNHLDEIASNLATLFTNGVSVDGVTHYGALIGSKGDLKFQKEIANLTRSYAHMGRHQSLHMCSLCHAGEDRYPMEDCQLEPEWRHSLFLDRPWSVTPGFSRVNFDPTCPEYLYKLDFFHIFKCGLGRDICGSTLLWLTSLGAYDYEGSTRNLPDRLTRCHSHFKLWATTNSHHPALRKFTKLFLNIKSSRSSPWTNSKGSDTMLILKYLRFFLGLLLTDPQENFAGNRLMLELCLKLVQNCLDMADLIYSHKMFLPRNCAAKLYLHIKIVLRAYKHLAKFFLDQKRSGFRLKPKFHALDHLAYELRVSLKSTAPLIISPILWSCEPNEDHVGRISKMSRQLATKTLTLRLTERYFLKSRALFRRNELSRKKRKVNG